MAMPSAASQDVHHALAHKMPSVFRDMAPVRISCHNWDDGEIFDWYRRQRHTTISKLELRKEKDHFKHEYIMAYLDNGWIHRVERRPVKGANTETVSKEGCEAEDSLTPVSDADLAAIHSESDAEITLEFGSNKPDLYNVIAVAIAISLNPQTQRYTLQQYNCYFVARSIIALVTRHCLLQSSPMKNLRWDRVTESTVLDHIFDGNWNNLESPLKQAMIPALEKLLWNVIKDDAGTRIAKPKDWDRLKEIVKTVIRDEVERCDIFLGEDGIPKAVTEWIIDATQMTLWYGNLEHNVSDPRHAKKYETTASGALNEMVKPQLEVYLPDNMIKGVSVILPDRLINRIPQSVLARLPSEFLARVPIKVLEKLPDDLLGKLPQDLLQNAPEELLQNLPVHIFSRLRDAVVLSLPDELGIVPQRLLEVALPRMQDLLDQPRDNPDRVYALELLRRLPDDCLAQLPSKYTFMREEPGEKMNPSAIPTIPEQPSDQVTPHLKPEHPLLRIKKRWDELSIIGFFIRIAPIPVLRHLPICVMDAIPTSSIKCLPPSAVERIPPEYIARMSEYCFARLPQELLEKLPETVLLKLPRHTLERLPTSLLERLPAQLIRNIPPELLENVPEDLTDLLRQTIGSSVFESEELKHGLREQVKGILKQTLIVSSGELPANLMQVSVRVDSRRVCNEKRCWYGV